MTIKEWLRWRTFQLYCLWCCITAPLRDLQTELQMWRARSPRGHQQKKFQGWYVLLYPDGSLEAAFTNREDVDNYLSQSFRMNEEPLTLYDAEILIGRKLKTAWDKDDTHIKSE